MEQIQNMNADQGVPSWITRRLGKLVELSAPCDEYPKGKRGVLLSIATKSRWGDSGVYCTVGFNLSDISDESNVELSQLRPVSLDGVRG
jgi:hypothetical protein